MNRRSCERCGAFLPGQAADCSVCVHALAHAWLCREGAMAAGFTHAIISGNEVTRGSEAEAIEAYKTSGGAFIALQDLDSPLVIATCALRSLGPRCELCGRSATELRPGPRGAQACDLCFRRYELA